jgi:coenzyme F420-reducing hydrogenase delta subunit
MHLEQQRAREQELQLEKNMGVRLRRLTYILLGIFTVVLLALYGWLYGLISNLAINAIKDQMIALVETSTAFIDGDAFETLVSSYGAADQSVYRDSYYSSLTRLLESIRANNSNITTRMTLYTVIKNGDDGVLVVASTLGELRFKSEFYPGGQGDIRVIGLQRTIADTNIVQDQNGSWISACTPILASTGKSTGALCTDFSADYLGEIRASVANTLLLTFLVVYPLMIGLIVFTTGSFRRSRKARS